MAKIIMGSSTSRLLLFFISPILIQFLVRTSIAQPDFLFNLCSSSGNYSSNSTYKTNLNTLLSFINNTEIDYGFYNFSEGENSNEVNAIALCRGDVAQEECRSCIYNSTIKLTQLCPNQKEAIGWYDNCMLRYSNRSIFGTAENYTFFMWNQINITNSSLNQFKTGLTNLLGNLRSRAASGSSLRKFATGEANFSSSQTLYALVQCTPDLSSLQCGNCLSNAISYLPQCCDGRVGGRVIGPSCNFRYEINKFYESTADAPSPAPSSPPPPQTNTTATTDDAGQGVRTNQGHWMIFITIFVVFVFY